MSNNIILEPLTHTHKNRCQHVIPRRGCIPAHQCSRTVLSFFINSNIKMCFQHKNQHVVHQHGEDQCKADTKAGHRCTRKAVPNGEGCCSQHYAMLPIPKRVSKPKCVSKRVVDIDLTEDTCDTCDTYNSKQKEKELEGLIKPEVKIPPAHLEELKKPLKRIVRNSDIGTSGSGRKTTRSKDSPDELLVSASCPLIGQQLDPNEECCICYEPLGDTPYLPCCKKNRIHYKCLVNAWVANGKPLCPICRCEEAVLPLKWERVYQLKLAKRIKRMKQKRENEERLERIHTRPSRAIIERAFIRV